MAGVLLSSTFEKGECSVDRSAGAWYRSRRVMMSSSFFSRIFAWLKTSFSSLGVPNCVFKVQHGGRGRGTYVALPRLLPETGRDLEHERLCLEHLQGGQMV